MYFSTNGSVIHARITRSTRAYVDAILLGLLVLVSLAFGASPASAHDPLEDSTPSADETVSTALTEVTLTFANAPLQGVPSAIQVTDPAGARVDDDQVTAAERSLSVRVAPTTAGVYSVRWQTVSSDAHTISGEFAFDYAGPLPSPSIEPSPTPAETTPSVTPTPAGSAADDTEPANEVGPFVPLIVGVIVIVVGAVVVAAIRASRAARARANAPAGPNGGETR